MNRSSSSSLKIGLAGFGTVGSSVWKRLQTQKELLRQRTGCALEICQVAVRRKEQAIAAGVPAEMVVDDWKTLVENPEIEVITELIGGTETAFLLIAAALKAGKHVVTANKALLAERGAELFKLADQYQCHLLFEASVAGGIPIIRAMREGLVANRIISLHGIINGTCNYILTRMNQGHLEFAEALAEAKKLGYAEADDSLDVDGHDTAHKAAVLAALAYGFWTPPSQLYTEGLRAVERQDLSYARKLGYELKLLAIIKHDDAGGVEVRVQPTLVPSSHVLASVNGVYNAVLVRGDVLGDALFFGRGAGGDPTASSVISDLAELATPCGHELYHSRAVGLDGRDNRLKSIDEIISRYYLRLRVEDRPGVLADVARILADRKIGVSSVIQPEASEGQIACLVIMVHDAQEANFRGAVAQIAKLAAVRSAPVSIRVEDFD